MPVRRIAALALLALAMSLRGPAQAANVPLRVVTSIPPLAMLAAQIGGDRVVVHAILPPGADAHTFEPRPSDAAAVADADIIVMLGSSIDRWLGDRLVPPAHVTVVRLDDGAAGDDEGRDPHVWLDPSWMREHAVAPIQRALAEADPAGAPRYGYSARAAAEDLADLEEDVRAELTGAATYGYLAWHPAWEHFAKRFGLHAVANIGESEGREPSLRTMIQAVQAGRAAGVRAVLVEPQMETRQAKVIADELDVPLVTVDPFGDAWSIDRSTYRTLMLFNAHAFARALAVERDETRPAPAPVSPVPASKDAR